MLDDLKTDIVEVKLWDKDTAGAYPAVREECYIEVVSYGGDTTGYQIPFNVHYTGARRKARLTRQPRSLRRRDRQKSGCFPEGEGFEERRVRWS